MYVWIIEGGYNNCQRNPALCRRWNHHRLVLDSSRLVYLHMFGSNRRDCRCSVCIDKVITSQTRTREQSREREWKIESAGCVIYWLRSLTLLLFNCNSFHDGREGTCPFFLLVFAGSFCFPLFGRVLRVSSRGRRILQLREREKKESVPQSWSSFSSSSLPVTCWDTIELNGRVVSKRANRFHPSFPDIVLPVRVHEYFNDYR